MDFLNQLINDRDVKDFLSPPKFFSDSHPKRSFESGLKPQLMVDWLTIKVPFFYPGILSGGKVTRSDENGELVYQVDTKLKVKGSFDSALYIRTEKIADGYTWLISISGNLVKFFQGHNIFGSDDVCGLVYETIVKLSQLFNAPQSNQLLYKIIKGSFSISRIDINCMYYLESRFDVYTWLESASVTARSRHGTAQTKGNTVYFGKNSSRWSVKCYSKGDEIEKHKIPTNIQTKSLIDYADNKLRIELTLRSKQLIDINLNHGTHWLNIDIFEIYKKFVGKIEMAGSTAKKHDIDIPKKLKSTYLLWQSGENLKDIISIRTFYRHRKALLKYDIDISIPRPSKPKTADVIPLGRVLELKPCGPPEWAYGTPLMFEPRLEHNPF